MKRKGLVTLGFLATLGSAQAQVVREVEIVISGGHELDPRDHGRPVILVASGLGVQPQVFREAFSHVRPAPLGQEPDPRQVLLNKEALMSALSKYGVTNDRLDEVSNYYRYNERREHLWNHRAAKLVATVIDGAVGKIAIVDGGSGYTSVPTLRVSGYSNLKLSVQMWFGGNLARNGSIAKVTIKPD